MTDYGEEQRNELEALESIYPDSFTGDFRGCGPGAARGWSGMGRSPRPPGPGMEKETARPRGHFARYSSSSSPDVFRHLGVTSQLFPFSAYSLKSESPEEAGEVPGECQAWN